MSDPQTPDDPVAVRLLAAVERLSGGLETTADRLQHNDDRIEASNAAIRDLAESTRRSRRQVIWLGTSVVLDVVLSIALAFFGVKVFTTSNDAKVASEQAKAVAIGNAENARNTCLSNNEARLLNVQLWDFVLGTFATPRPDQPPPTPEQTARVTQLRDFVHLTFAPKDCGPDPTPETPDVGLPPAATFPTSVTTVLPSTTASPPTT